MKLYRDEFKKINLELWSLRDRVSSVKYVAPSAPVDAPNCATENIISEFTERERERRSAALMFFNLAEANPSVNHTHIGVDDSIRVEEILRVIEPVNPFKVKVQRLGKRRDDTIRPIRVSFSTSAEELEILRKKKSYSIVQQS